jgi:glycine betaine/proline transport system substrate-binding protein
LKTHRNMWVVVMALMLALFVAACGEEKEEPTGGGDGGAAAGKDCGNVIINENAWAGSTANVYIAKAVLEDELGCEVEVTKLAEIPVFQAMADGKVDAVLEDWQHVDEYEQYIEKQKTVVMGGPLGVEGHIGWFTPQYVMDENPEFKTWEGLKGKEDVFNNEFLGGDPSYVQKDKELIKALGLDLKHVTAGAEPAQVARWSQAYKQEEPVLFYWYTPQYLNQEYDLAEVKLPPRTEANKDCKDDAKEGGDPEQYKCEYDITIINKLFSKKFADSGSPAYDVLSKMELTNEDQELVAKAIAGDKQDPEEAGADWVADNQDKVQAWLE